MHLADTFIQSDLQGIQAIHFFYQYVYSLGIEPTTFCAANAKLYHWAKGMCRSVDVCFQGCAWSITWLFTDLISVCQSSRSLNSNDQLLLMVLRSRLKCRGVWAFSVAAPRLWNALPLSIKSSATLGAFQSALETHLFSLAFDNAF